MRIDFQIVLNVQRHTGHTARYVAKRDDGRRALRIYKGRGESAGIARGAAGLWIDFPCQSGRKLEHDFVVLSLSSGKLIDGAASLRLPQTSASVLANGRAALVAWITKPGALEPIQSVGGWLR